MTKALSKTNFRKWQFCTRFDIPDRADPSVTYLTRWRILQTPWFGIYIHKIYLHDSDVHLHDHPWPFVSLVLRGGYCEQRQTKVIRRGWMSLGFRRSTDLHRIVDLLRRPTWTLLLVGRKRRRWGFQTDSGWIDYRTYFWGEKPVD